MGLDMYLRGKTYLWNNWENPERDLKRDGFRVSEIELELGYWRKHPDLHGYIVQQFAGGVDECQEIQLSSDDMIKIVQAIKDKSLPKTTGFFFGESDGSEDKQTIEIFLAAIKWLEGVPVFEPLKPAVPIGGGFAMAQVDIDAVKQLKESRSVYYHASW